MGSTRGVVLSLQVTISVLSGALFATGVLTNDTIVTLAAVLALVSRAGTRQKVVAAEQSPPSAAARHCVALPRALPVCKPLSSKAANVETNVYGIACIDLAQEKGRTDV